MRLTWEDGQFRLGRPGLRPLPADAGRRRPTPSWRPESWTSVGRLSRAARRVEVPFEFIAPPPEQWWTGDSRRRPRRAARPRRRHLAADLRLGQGTAQHVLIAGKTGSGKSTLLHALITNLALLYSPDEVELYLVDFKKGVEFKTYAAHDLPHARRHRHRERARVRPERAAAARRRAEGARRALPRGGRAGPQRAYRQAQPGRALPRILLIVDEFQEFFTEDDRIAQDAAQLLDRLVRQGRAFGLHVLLGSQTLGGAYSLARSTIDQMAVRIACSAARPTPS